MEPQTTGNAITAWHVIAALAVVVQLLVACVVGLATYSFRVAIAEIKAALKEAVGRLERAVETLFDRQAAQGAELSELKGEHNSQMQHGGCVRIVRTTDPSNYDPSPERCNRGERRK